MVERILILAPKGRDAEVIGLVFERHGIVSQACDDLSCLCQCLESEVGGMILTEEALSDGDVQPLLAWCETQPPWSDIPVIVLATKRTGHRSLLAASMLERLGNVTLLERPVNAETLGSAARAAIRGRHRQYQTRDLLLNQERTEKELVSWNSMLEQRVEERARELDRANAALRLRPQLRWDGIVGPGSGHRDDPQDAGS